jgi:hypothetical protein
LYLYSPTCYWCYPVITKCGLILCKHVYVYFDLS